VRPSSSSTPLAQRAQVPLGHPARPPPRRGRSWGPRSAGWVRPCARSPSSVSRIRPVVSASSRPTGYSRRPGARTMSTTTGRPWVSLAVETTPAGLCTAHTWRCAPGAGEVSGCPSTRIASFPVTSRAGSVTTFPSTWTRPAAMICSAPRREATPAWARCLPSLIPRAPRARR
jgi:hypothetical protein